MPEFDDRDDNIADDDESDIGHLKPKRQQWSSKMQFVLACVGYSIGLGNVIMSAMNIIWIRRHAEAIIITFDINFYILGMEISLFGVQEWRW